MVRFRLAASEKFSAATASSSWPWGQEARRERGLGWGETRGQAPGDEEREHLGGKGADVDVGCQLASEGAGTRGRRRSLGAGARDVEARGYSGDVVTGEGGWFGRADGRGGARSLGGAIPNGCTAKKWGRASHLESDEDLILGVDAVEDGLPSVPVLEAGRATVL